MGGQIQLTDALLNVDILNALETDAGIHDCGDKQDFMYATCRWVYKILVLERRSAGSFKKMNGRIR